MGEGGLLAREGGGGLLELLWYECTCMYSPTPGKHTIGSGIRVSGPRNRDGIRDRKQ